MREIYLFSRPLSGTQMDSMKRYDNILLESLKKVKKTKASLLNAKKISLLGPLGDEITSFVKLPLMFMRKRNELIHITNQEYAYLTNFLKNSIVTVHDFYLFNARFNYKFRMSLSLRALRRADKILAVSKDAKKFVVDRGIPENKVEVIYEGVDLNKFKKQAVDKKILSKFNLPKNKKILFYVGSDMPRKNVLFLPEIIDELSKINDEYHLVIAGNLDHKRKLENKIEELKLNEKITLTGGLNDKELVAFYNTSFLLVFPSKAEGFGFPIVEAQACGTPAIANNNTAISETCLKETLMDNFDSKKWAQRINKIASNKKEYQVISKKALNHSKKFDLKISIENNKKFYEKYFTEKENE